MIEIDYTALYHIYILPIRYSCIFIIMSENCQFCGNDDFHDMIHYALF